MKITALCNQKGGVFKTTTTKALCSGLAKKGYRVLAVDLDPQSNLTMDVNPAMMASEESLYDVFDGRIQLSSIIKKAPDEFGFDIVMGGIELAAADMNFTQVGREYMLKKALDTVSDQYDYCVIDCPPSLGILIMNALAAVNRGIIVPMSVDLYPLQGLNQLSDIISRIKTYCNPGLNIDGILLTRFDRTNATKALMNDIRNAAVRLNTKVYNTKIRTSTAVRESAIIHKDLLTYAPKVNAVVDFKNFVDEFLSEENA